MIKYLKKSSDYHVRNESTGKHVRCDVNKNYAVKMQTISSNMNVHKMMHFTINCI